MAFVVVVGVVGLSTEVGPNIGSPSSATSTAYAAPRSDQQVAAAPAATPRGTASAAAKLAAGLSGKTTRAEVVRVVDGDTILVAFGGKRYRVRYLGVETPATVRRAALAANKAFVAGRTVMLEADVSDTDRSGRLLRYVWLGDGSALTLVNLELVRLGFATVATNSTDRKYADRYVAAEREARARHRGLWGPAPKPKPTPKLTRTPPRPLGPPVGPFPLNRR